MKRSRAYVALVLVYLFVPGTFEATENLAHLVTHGGLAHAVQDDDHGPGAEHDCSGLFHSCLCHSSVVPIMTVTKEYLVMQVPRRNQRCCHSAHGLATGYPDSLYRPPIA